MGRWTIVNTLLGCIVALLGFEIVRTWARGLPPVTSPTPTAAPAPEPHEGKGKRAADKGGARAQQTPTALVAAIAEKDLFDPSRRPPAPDEVKVETASVTKPPDNVTVVGVRIFGKDREVFISDATQNPPVGRRLRVGDQVAGYTVKVIEPRGITLTSPSGDSVGMGLTLDKGKAGAPAPGPVPGGRLRVPQPTPVPASPAAGAQTASPAAGIPVKPPAPPVPAVVTPPPQPGGAGGTQPQQQLPTEVRQKLEQLKQKDKRAGRRN